MIQFVYWPYDEVTITQSEDEKSVLVRSPWMEARVKIDDDNRENLTQLVRKSGTGELTPQDLPLINYLFQGLSEFPLAYILPAKKSVPDQHTTKDRDLLNLDLPAFLKRVLHTWTPGGFPEKDADAVLSPLPRKSWDWDVESALSFATVDGLVHPESLFTVARRFHLIDVMQANQARAKFNFIEKLAGTPAFAEAVSVMVRQNHYVTQRCRGSLLPALETAQSAKDEVHEFIQEENGHDLILGVAIKSITEDPEKIPVSEHAKALMHLLGFAGHRNFLSFAMVVDCFERSTYESVDPLAALLRKGGFEKAAKQVNRHKEINDAGEHENVALGFLQHMAPVSVEYAKEALRIAELVTLVMNHVPESAIAQLPKH